MDKSSPDYDSNYRYLLEFIVYLTIAGECAFVMSDSLGNIKTITEDQRSLRLNLNDMIVAFDREGILEIDEIFSLKDLGTTGTNRRSPHSRFSNYRNYNVKISDYSLKKSERITQKEWNEYWDFSFVWTSGRGNTEFSDYFLRIKNGNTRDAIYLRHILGI